MATLDFSVRIAAHASAFHAAFWLAADVQPHLAEQFR